MKLYKQIFFVLSLLAFLSSASARSLFSPSPSSDPEPTTRRQAVESKLSSVENFHLLSTSSERMPHLVQQTLPKPDASFHVDKTVNRACSNTDYVAECIASVLPSLHGKPVVKPADILNMEMQALNDKANATLILVRNLMVNPTTSKAVASVLDTCVDNYESLIEDLRDVQEAADVRGDSGRLESVLSATISDIVTCSDAFTEKLMPVVAPLAEVDGLLKKLCSNVLALSQTINKP